MNKTTKPSREEVLRVVGDPVAEVYVFGTAVPTLLELPPLAQVSNGRHKLYTEAQLIAAYAKGAEDMRERVIRSIGDSDDQLMGDFHIERIRALPMLAEQAPCDITPTNTEGEQHADI